MHRLRLFGCTAVLVLGAVGTASGDLLVTKQGATIETAGPWKVQGRQIVFTLPNGALSSIRTDAIDLDRSALATAHAAEAAKGAEAAPAKPAAPTEPVMRLTEADFPPVPESDDDESQAAAKPADTQTANEPLTVSSWDKVQMPSGDGVQVFGTVKNTSTTHVTSPALMVSVYGEGGGLLATSDATISSASIAPGSSANFHAEFPGLPDFVSVKFAVSARGFETRPPAGEESSGDVGDQTGGTADTTSADDLGGSDVQPASDAPSNDEAAPAAASDADSGPPPLF